MTAQTLQAPIVAPLSRREFLYYIWGASMTLFMAQMGGAILWFAFPRFKEGEFGGIITVPVTDIPAVDSMPKDMPDARVWLVNLGAARVGDPRQPADYPVQAGVKALYKICVHLGCLYKWAPANDRFECPCHGSKYLTSGSRVDGPARRNLDTFPIEFVDAAGKVLASSAPTGAAGVDENAALEIPKGAVALRINTAFRVQGASNTQPGGGL